MGGSPSKLGEPLRKLQRWEGLGPSWVSLGANWEGLRDSWEGLRASWEGPEASWEAPGEDGQTKTEEIFICGDAIGHQLLQGRWPKER